MNITYILDVLILVIATPLFLTIITLMIGWNVYFIVQSWRLYNEYKTCKQTPVLHPLYTDVQYLSKQRKLYNLKTHITKYLLMIFCSFVELANIVGFGIVYIFELSPRPTHTTLFFGNLNCKTYVWFLLFFGDETHILMTNFTLMFSSLLPITLAILSRYLAARYLNHPFKRTLIKYLIWCCVQCILIGFCSTTYTWIFLLLLVPIFSITNWIVLLRDTSILSRVLRSNLRDIQLYSDNRVFYNQQLSAFKFYRIFRIVSLVSLFVMFLAQMQIFLHGTFRMVFFEACSIHLWNNVNFPISIQTHFDWLIFPLLDILNTFIFLLYSLSLCLPLCGITFIPIILKCVKRCREKEDQYRYNYDKLEPLLKKY